MNQASTQSPTAASAGVDLRKRGLAVGIGNFMEWFDFAIYGYFAAVIGAQFFPSDDPSASLLASLATFAAGFLARPIGALVLGPLGDRLGRRAVLVITVFGMGVATALMGLLPTFDQIGIWAPALMVVLRLVQGMMVGGEWSSAAAYLIESAPGTRRARTATILTTTAGLAFLTGTVLATLLTATLSAEQVAAWGWRLPFLASFVMAVVAIYIRRRLGETPVFEQVAARRAAGETAPLRADAVARAFVLALTFSALFGVSLYYLITYANNHLSGVVGMARFDALLACSIGLGCYVLVNPLIGMIADRIGRRPVVLASAAGLVLLGLPIFWLWDTGSFPLVLLGLVVLGVLVAMAGVMNVVLLVEVFPASIRSSGAALGHNIALALLAGPGPFIAALLIRLTGNSLAPAGYLVAVALLAGIVLATLLPETLRRDISE
ncbi:MHS family proline/betaine transporter-like MFS transporter [Naumannella cuiyingiana]|uniref:Putative proline/betaine transporter n=1 Tax=Naumannella cuiyingiana TaxID=1347891 RepID=A0A7Z0D7A1_9ACTN|nr:MFS transporter [Naumannella cuiyingiana]NYI70208.1 MHS family proline/betaine transporter-like MFS transporter [Naumannella cuiyingiana]